MAKKAPKRGEAPNLGGAGLALALLLGAPAASAAALAAHILRGLPFPSFGRVQLALDLSTEELAAAVSIPPRTLARRKQSGTLGAEESDRLARLARVTALALALFEQDGGAARRWMKAPSPALGGRTPLEATRTDLGAREVEHLIARLEHGVLT